MLQGLKLTLNCGTKTLGKLYLSSAIKHFEFNASFNLLVKASNILHKAYPSHYTTDVNFPPTLTALKHRQMIIVLKNPNYQPALQHLQKSLPQNKTRFGQSILQTNRVKFGYVKEMKSSIFEKAFLVRT